MNKYQELKELIESYETDFLKFYLKGNKTAGVRLRKHMQDLRIFAKDVRIEVQELNQERAEDT